MSKLAKKVAFVTGGSRGIGAAIAKRLAADGASVAITYVNGKSSAEAVVAAIEATGGKALAIQADSADTDQVGKAISRAVSEFGPIDILVNNAGIFPTGLVVDTTDAEFDRAFAINVKSGFAAARAALKSMPDGGRIIFIGSTLALRVHAPGLSVYAATKGAVAVMAQALARELGPRKITVNTVHPGSTDTDMNPSDGPFASAQLDLMSNPVGFASADEIANVVGYLASPDARSVTGAAWTIDNGATV
ncbi:SDR family NAD(P)-dependent oxidoreductase [Rhizobium leguminosarum]|uniref:SDR family NAD(P)-dependent oxidoreductase n=1 Tax=Rhizobium leguminosarum TaxID=384 RepID=UPI00143F3596|nr:SDR family oxidoreductase [Rhizobium leguminosarum]NKL21797.1 SDR family oxidoreductase [Rhizobium leguminosarum bv. viciae]